MQVAAALAVAVFAHAQEEFGPEFVCKEANYKTAYPRRWTRAKEGVGPLQLALIGGGDFLGVLGSETSASPEAILETIEEEKKLTSEEFKPLGTVQITVAGERALQMRARIRNQGISMTFYVTVFTHQGIAYRVVGVHGLGKREEFEKDYLFLLDSFAFLAERREWLEKYRGKAARTAILGGLGSLELNRPRWTESTFETRHDWSLLDQLDFTFISQTTWVRVRARESSLEAPAELDQLAAWLSSLFQKSVSTPFVVKTPAGELACVEIRCLWREQKYILRLTVFRVDGIALRVWMEGYDHEREVTRKDWEQLLAGLRLRPRSRPETPPAFPVRSSTNVRKADPSLAAVLGGATRVSAEASAVITVSPDGARALLSDRDEGVSLVDLASGKGTKLAGLHLSATAAWSPDGKRILLPGDPETLVVTLDPFAVQKLPVACGSGGFGPAPDELMLCVTGPQAAPFQVSRLEVMKGDGGGRRALVEFPLSRVAFPVLSPDGKRIALVTNRDYPRSAASGGHIYVCDTDGKNLRRLTEGPEQPWDLSWSSDGTAVYALRRLSAGEDGAVGSGGRADLYRVPVDSGPAVNLTRSGRIGGTWVAGKEFLLKVTDWGVPEGQKGLFRITSEVLEKATSGRPEPPLLDRAAHGRVVGERVRAALGGVDLRDLVPTPELLEKAARAFAGAVREATGRDLDFKMDSLGELPEMHGDLDAAAGDRAVILGLGAYYGETLRREAGAEWRLRPVPFGDWTPGTDPEGNPMADPILPFSAAWGLGSEDFEFRGPAWLAGRDEGCPVLLLYPPSQARELVAEATGKEYAEARRRLDAGEVREALAILVRELQRRPMSRGLAQEAISICEAAGMADAARALTEQAVEAGNEVPELLVRYADRLMEREPRAAIEYYRKAARTSWPSAEVFLKLGKAYAAFGDRPLAEACWRRAYMPAGAAERKEICRLMEIPDPPADPD